MFFLPGRAGAPDRPRIGCIVLDGVSLRLQVTAMTVHQMVPGLLSRPGQQLPQRQCAITGRPPLRLGRQRPSCSGTTPSTPPRLVHASTARSANSSAFPPPGSPATACRACGARAVGATAAMAVRGAEAVRGRPPRPKPFPCPPDGVSLTRQSRLISRDV